MQATRPAEDNETCGFTVWASEAVGAQIWDLSPSEHCAYAQHLLSGGTNYQEPEHSCRDDGAPVLIIGRLPLVQSPGACLVLWYQSEGSTPGALLAEGSIHGGSLTVITNHSGLVLKIHLPTEVQTRTSLCQLILDSFISSSFTHD